MSRLPVPGSDNNTWGQLLNDFLDVAHNSDGTIQTAAITSAGGYVKPGGGIPGSDLSSQAQTSLTRANSSVQSVNNKTPSSGNVSLTANDVGALPINTPLASLADTAGAAGANNNQVLAYNSTTSQWTAATISSSTVNDATTSTKGIIELAGDLGGTAATPSVLKINGVGVSGTAGNGKAIIASSSSAAAWSTIPSPSNATNGATGLVQLAGDLSGTATAPTVAKLNGITAPASAPTQSGQVLTSTSTSTTAWQTLASAPVSTVFGRAGAVTAQNGDYTASQVGALPSSDDLSAIATANVTAGNVSMNSHKITNLTNGSASQDAATYGQIPTSLPPTGTAGGDLSGTYPNPTLSNTTSVETIISANTTVAGALQKSSNLSDVASVSSARASLGLGGAATENIGTTSGTVAAGNDSRIVGAMQVGEIAFSGTNATANVTLTAGTTQGFDTTSGAITATLPTAPADNTTICVGHLVQGGTNILTIATGSGDTFNTAGGSITVTLPTKNQKMLLVYRSSPKIWFVYDFVSIGSLDTRYLTTAVASSLYLTPFGGWQPNTSYPAGYPVFYDAGDGNGLQLRISKNVFTSGSTFNSANWYTVGTGIATNSNAALIQPTGVTLAAGATGAFADAGHIHTVPTETVAANILPMGIASSGTSANFPHADHVHPSPQWLASDSGLISWTYDGALATSNSALSSGVIIFAKLKVALGTTLTNVIFYVQQSPTTNLTTGQSGAALFDATGATQLAVTGDLSGAGNLGSTGMKTIPWSSPYTAAAGIYTVAFWSNWTGGTALQLERAGTNAPTNGVLTGSASRYGTAQPVTSTPSSLSGMASAQIAWWFAFS